jgi:hypothetical protein
MTITNPALVEFRFLDEMFEDDYFPDPLVEKCVLALKQLCEKLEAKPDKAGAIALSEAAVETINALMPEFIKQDSELETGARDAICDDFHMILSSYGYEVDEVDEFVGNRDF